MIYKDDYISNKNNTKGLLFILIFRISSYLNSKKKYYLLRPFIILLITTPYTLIIQWLMGIDIPLGTRIGKGFMLYHGMGVVINKKSIIGDFVKIRHNVTIGNAKKNGNCPILGSNIDIGANTVIIGDITVGNNVNIGALTLVNKSIKSNNTVVGIPAKII
jgi:serine acetyltransferase